MNEMILTYKLYKLAKDILEDDVFQKLKKSLQKNSYLKKYSQKIAIIQKNNFTIILLKFKNIESIDQIALQFQKTDEQLIYNISVYCKDGYMDNKFYYSIDNILNKSSKTFKIESGLQVELIKYFNEMFNKYFQIYDKNFNNGLYV